MDQLPEEVWLHIFTYLDLHSLRSVELVNRKFNHLLSDDVFWFQKYKSGLGGEDLSIDLSLPWKKIVYKLMGEYGYLSGYWQMFTDEKDSHTFRHNGVLLYFEISPKEGKMYGFITTSPESPERHQFHRAYSVDAGGNFSLVATTNVNSVAVSRHEVLEEPINSTAAHLPPDEHAEYMNRVYTSEIVEINGLKETVKQPSRWVKVREFSYFSKEFIEPGIFSAVYGSHGTELLYVCFLKTENKIIGSKLLGDENVPYGKHSFVIDLNRPIMLTSAEQADIQTLTRAVESREGSTECGSQPFVIPSDVFYEHEGNIASYDMCIARYAGAGTIAYTTYKRASWTPVHFIQFDADTFAVLFPALNSVSLFKRQKKIVLDV